MCPLPMSSARHPLETGYCLHGLIVAHQGSSSRVTTATALPAGREMARSCFALRYECGALRLKPRSEVREVARTLHTVVRTPSYIHQPYRDTISLAMSQYLPSSSFRMSHGNFSWAMARAASTRYMSSTSIRWTARAHLSWR
jgi:hypothetical protein